jgi:deoxyribonuclease-4
MQHYYGSHIGKSQNGWLDSLHTAHDRGLSAVQIFIGNPMSGKMSEKTEADYMKVAIGIRKFLATVRMKLFIHSPYVLNFAKDPYNEYPYWVDAMVRELKIAQEMGAEGSVLHLGKAVNNSHSQGAELMYQNVKHLLLCMRENKMTVKLFLETSSGQGTELFATTQNSLQDLADFFERFDATDRLNLGICVDTCHIFAAGYDISTPDQVAAFFTEWENKIGIAHLSLIHFNNSVYGCGSRKDRHSCIEHGAIGVDGLLQFLRVGFERGIPAVLETPGGLDEVSILAAVSQGVYVPSHTRPSLPHSTLRTLEMLETMNIPDEEL